ncbi:hypothetical protein AXF42_Ash000721 [Apostasia shenzhenica]|uniref:Orn/Lys/Arg decarboxylases family 1 pyridoxal-P attachment site domain-containing protein n=1 Tax=Apostasia shenzhenica TaxID=1088818 RepID=A0A2I0AHC0_9ASPA|nr:hypothetical protein AXF42_Ash000721 [Apostasia shenzhenica]
MPECNSEWDISGGMTAFQVEQALKDLEAENKRASAVLVTSPTYDGICSNITEVRDLCHSYRIPVIVDEAHGGHFGFHDHLPETALEQKSRPCRILVERDRISRCLQMLQSSSPNNLLLASLDAARALLSENPNSIFTPAIDFAIKAKRDLKKISGISVLKSLELLLELSRHLPISNNRRSIAARDLRLSSR